MLSVTAAWLLMDEKLDDEAGHVRCVECLAQGLNQSLVVGYRTLLIIRLLSLVSQEEPVRIRKVTVVIILLIVTWLFSKFLQIFDVNLFDFLGSLEKVLERVWQSVSFVFCVAETEHGLKHLCRLI